MPRDLSTEILNNSYLEKLRTDLVIDKQEYERLCYSLRCLAKEWKWIRSIDKKIAQELYVLAPVTRNIAESVQEYNSKLAQEIAVLSLELDALVLECLTDS
jgi:hypothetical protein